ncbi:MAG: hypothetical protein J6S85_09810 [Methanobrevibacter sp.]|nr:hypothetical protein [Methanobrevibacter sp.]
MEKKITLSDVIEFIVKNSENKERMDKINKITFPFTTKYASFSNNQTVSYKRVQLNNDNDFDFDLFSKVKDNE